MPGTDEENDSPKVKRDDVAYEEARILVSNIPFRYRNMDLTLLCSKYGSFGVRSLFLSGMAL